MLSTILVFQLHPDGVDCSSTAASSSLGLLPGQNIGQQPVFRCLREAADSFLDTHNSIFPLSALNVILFGAHAHISLSTVLKQLRSE